MNSGIIHYNSQFVNEYEEIYIYNHLSEEYKEELTEYVEYNQICTVCTMCSIENIFSIEHIYLYSQISVINYP